MKRKGIKNAGFLIFSKKKAINHERGIKENTFPSRLDIIKLNDDFLVIISLKVENGKSFLFKK